MTEPHLSVVVPTRNRRETLERTLAEALDQARDVAAEVIVVDDGSTDDTLEWLHARAASSKLLQVIAGTGAGPAAARNLGITRTKGRRVLLLGDDTRPDEGCLRIHAEERAERGLQGRIDWDPEREITPLMDFLAPSGPQFWFDGLVPDRRVPWTGVLGSNLSTPRTWFVDAPFDEGFPAAAMEDTELAWRWSKRGRSVVWRPEARCWHEHHYDDLPSFLARQRRAGRAARYAVGLHPTTALRLILQPTAFAAVVGLRHALRRLRGRARPQDRWDLQCRRAFLQGFLERSEPDLPPPSS